MIRVRMTFSKRGRACFIPHIAVPSVLTRGAARASVQFVLTEGFSPRPKISLGPELSAGVPALAEPFEARLAFYDEGLPARWSARLPEGFAITGATVIDAAPGTEGARAMGRLNLAASYLLALRGREDPALEGALENLAAGGLVHSFQRYEGLPGGFRLIMQDPAKRGPGALVKALSGSGLIPGWSGVFILREAVGLLSLSPDGKDPRVEPLAPPLPGGTAP